MIYDVIAVNMATHRVTVLAEKKTELDAGAAVARMDCDESFYTTVPHGQYADGAVWYE